MSRTPRGASPTRNPYEGRWKWWYSSIADWMIRNPDKALQDCAAELDKHPNTISMIVNTDLFKDYLAQRRAAYREGHDFAVQSKLTRVAEASLDGILSVLEKKKDQVPLQVLNELAKSSLENLGYGQKNAPGVLVNVQQNDNRSQTVVLPSASLSELEEARMALRVAEQRRVQPVIEIAAPVPLVGDSVERDEGAEQVLEGEVVDASLP